MKEFEPLIGEWHGEGEIPDGTSDEDLPRGVVVHGAYTAQRALEAGVLDELQIHQIPVLFGGGSRLFELLPSRIELEIVRVIDTPEATHIRHRVRR
jgi:dihydrofolate reductase